MNDRPTAAELIDAVRLYLEKELLPALTDARLRFQTLVAANVLSIAGRELHVEVAMLREDYREVATILECEPEPPADLEELRQGVRAVNESLCAHIQSGMFDAPPERWHEVVALVRRLVVRKLEVANPRYLQSAGP